MTDMENKISTTDLTYEDIRKRKRIVLEKLRKEKAKMDYFGRALLDEYRLPKIAGLTSIDSVRKTGQVVSGVFYAYRVLKSVGKVIGVFRH